MFRRTLLDCKFWIKIGNASVLLNLFLATQDEEMRRSFGVFDIFCVISLQMHSPSKKAIMESRTPLKTLTPKVCPFRIKGLLAACLLLVYSVRTLLPMIYLVMRLVWGGGGRHLFGITSNHLVVSLRKILSVC